MFCQKPHFCKNTNFVKNFFFLCKSFFQSKFRLLTNFFLFSSPNVEILVECRNFGHTSKFWSQVEILVTSRNFRQKSKFWVKKVFKWKNFFFHCKSFFQSKFRLLTNFFFVFFAKRRNFDHTSKFWSHVEILVTSRNFGHKSKFWSQVEILVKSRNFG